MDLENQQKIIINTNDKFGFSVIKFAVTLFFLILIPIGVLLTAIIDESYFPIIIIAFIGVVISGFCDSEMFSCCNKSFIYYNINNKNLEIHCLKKN